MIQSEFPLSGRARKVEQKSLVIKTGNGKTKHYYLKGIFNSNYNFSQKHNPSKESRLMSDCPNAK